MIEAAYRLAEASGIPVWCQDEAGPYQAIPQSGAGWFGRGDPGRQPHEYVRGGTAKLLILFRPATGEVRATGVIHAPNIVLHPWLQAELSAILGALPETPPPIASAPFLPDWWERVNSGQEFPKSRGSEFPRQMFDSSLIRFFAHSSFLGSVRSWKMPACRFSRKR